MSCSETLAVFNTLAVKNVDICHSFSLIHLQIKWTKPAYQRFFKTPDTSVVHHCTAAQLFRILQPELDGQYVKQELIIYEHKTTYNTLRCSDNFNSKTCKMSISFSLHKNCYIYNLLENRYQKITKRYDSLHSNTLSLTPCNSTQFHTYYNHNRKQTHET